MNKWVKQQLAALVAEKAVRQGRFKLANGNTSDYYIDTDLVALTPGGADLIGQALDSTLLPYEELSAIGGPLPGAGPIVCSVLHGHLPVVDRAFLIRRGLKKHGHKTRIDGPLRKGDRVAIVEGVTTSGRSALWAAKFVQEHYKCKVLTIVTLVDRLSGAAELLKKEGYKFESILTIDDLDFHMLPKPIPPPKPGAQRSQELKRVSKVG